MSISDLTPDNFIEGSDGTKIGNEGDNLKVLDSANESAITGLKSVGGTEITAQVGGSPLSGRKTVLIQPLDKDIKVGFTSGQLHHLVAAGNFFEAKISDAITLYMVAVNPSTDVAITELK